MLAGGLNRGCERAQLRAGVVCDHWTPRHSRKARTELLGARTKSHHQKHSSFFQSATTRTSISRGNPSSLTLHTCLLLWTLPKCWHNTSEILCAVISRIEEKLFAPSAPCPLVSFVTCHKQSVCYNDEVRAEDAEGCTGCPGIEAG